MTPERFAALTGRYARLRVAVVGDLCLDRYLEIDPTLAETSIETGLPVRNVVRVRAQPGGAGTVIANLAALGIGGIHVVGGCGDDGEGYELRRALARLPGVRLDRVEVSPERATFTYCKPLVVEPGRPPRELERLDRKERSPTPPALAARFAAAVRELAAEVDALIVLEQTELRGTGVVTAEVLAALGEAAAARPAQPILADSRLGFAGWPPLSFKLNAAELAKHVGAAAITDAEAARAHAAALARRNRRPVFVTLAERGIVAADPAGATAHRPALPLRGPIDVVGAGDAVTANLAAALAAGAASDEAIELANAAASVVIHQLGTTGAADLAALRERLGAASAGAH